MVPELASTVTNETGQAPPADASHNVHDEEFRCRRCGNCCRGDGYVWLTDDDIERIARFLRLTRKELVARCTRRAPGLGDIALVDKDDAAKSCVFLEDDGRCAVHPVKPVQCVGFPSTWSRSDALRFCEGLQAQRRASNCANAPATGRRS